VLSFNVGDKVVTCKALGDDPEVEDYVPVGQHGRITSIIGNTVDAWPYTVTFDEDCYVDWIVSEDEIQPA
jgi:hypothetical protein